MAVEVHALSEVLFQRDIEPDSFTYNTLMDGYLLISKMNEVLRLFNFLVANGHKRNEYTYYLLMNTNFRSERIDFEAQAKSNLNNLEGGE